MIGLVIIVGAIVTLLDRARGRRSADRDRRSDQAVVGRGVEAKDEIEDVVRPGRCVDARGRGVGAEGIKDFLEMLAFGGPSAASGPLSSQEQTASIDELAQMEHSLATSHSLNTLQENGDALRLFGGLIEIRLASVSGLGLLS